MTKFIFRTLVTMAVAWLFPMFLHAQKTIKPGMFWRITGNGLSKPSYLLGTMHLKDKRIFNFPDSMYAAIEQTEGMAIEMAPVTGTDSAAAAEENLLLKPLLSAAQFRRIEQKLKTAFDKKPEEVTFSEFESYCRLQVINLDPKNNMSSVMDNYLYAIASRKGKWMGAVEERHDEARSNPKQEAVSYIDGFLKTDKELRAGIDTMVEIYSSNDLDRMMKRYGSVADDKVMVTRNQNMVRRIDSLIRVRTMFFAVGAAHLGQDVGLVSLLRHKGYTVEPVVSGKRIPMEEHLFSQTALAESWITVNGLDSLYSIRMPGKPSEVLNKPDAEMLVFADDLAGMAYLTLASGKVYGMGIETVAKGTFRSMKAEVRSTKKISRFGVEGMEFTAYNAEDNSMVIMQMFIINGRCFAVGMGYPQGMEMPEARLKEYFDSYKVFEKPDTTGNQLVKSYELTDNKLGFSVWFPGKPVTDSVSETESAYVRQIMVSDDANKAMLMCMVETLRKDYTRISNKDKFESYVENLRNNPNIRIDSTTELQWNGYPAFWVKYQLTANKDSIFCNTLNILKGNQSFYFMTLNFYEPGNGELMNKYFSSVKFIPKTETPWGNYQLPDGSAATWAPQPFEIYQDTAKQYNSSQIRMLSYDSITPATIEIVKAKLNPYFWEKSDTAVLRRSAMKHVHEVDTLLSYNLRKQGPFDAVETMIKSNATGNAKRILYMLHSDSLVTVFVNGDSSTIFNSNYNKLYASYQPAAKVIASGLSNRKPEDLFTALKSSDSATLGKAYAAMEMVEFKTEHLPLLHKALAVSYYEGLTENAAPALICDAIVAIKDPSSLNEMAKAYAQLAPANDNTRNVILNALIKWGTDSSYQLVSKLANLKFPATAEPYSWLRGYADSASLAAAHIKDLLPLLKDTIAAQPVMRYVNRLLEEKAINKSILAPFKESIYKYADHLALKDKDEPRVFWNQYNTAQVLGAMKDAGAVQGLRKLLQNKSTNVKMLAVNALLPLNQTIPPAELLKIAADRNSRVFLYDTLASLKKLAVFPKQYLNQKAIAESELISEVDEDEYEIDQFVFVGERVVNFKNAKKKFLLFRLTFKGSESSSYLGVAGPFSITPGAPVKRRAEATSMLYEKEYDATTLDDDLKQWLQSIEEGAKEE
ncbi:hypothetical protein HHL16_06300 [Pseudoflavitalea sp. G-6-1-2]|uniref:TraB/GumN family protein n=1 Tax=Pseudoflavitalea sp. G-6-1-2 TaxID=2728841 RepID=UPI00146B12A9|nr:TraB/GumN family protein [Pseudoflavitalea sp. G-6-1-2]NML20475.1 hypothetical protein [Pseudoflavitalea sp. G-6-1-2]